MAERKKIGVALSGGGIRGLAHIGVLRVLEEYNIPIDFIAGTSMGAFIGALYSAEPNAKKIEKEALNEKISDLFDYTISKSGFIKGDKIEKYLEKRLDDIQFKDLKIKLFVTAYDLVHKREVIFSKGDVAKAVRASISLPGLFVPVTNKGEILVDGGVVDPLPTEVLKKAGADIIIAVNVDFMKAGKIKYGEKARINSKEIKLPSAIEVFLKSIEVAGARASEADLIGSKADLVINIPLEDISLLDDTKKKKAIEAGKRYSRMYISDIRKLHQHNELIEFIDQLQKTIGINKIATRVKEVKKAVDKAAAKSKKNC